MRWEVIQAVVKSLRVSFSDASPARWTGIGYILLARSGRKLGPHWLCGDGKDRIISKMLATVERLRPRYLRE
jgi:hypothetical protein